MRWDSPFVLATAGTFAIHLLILIAGDAVIVLNPSRPDPPAPHIEMIEVEVPPIVQPEPPPPVEQPRPPEAPAPPPPQAVVRTQKPRPTQRATEPPPAPREPPPATSDRPTPGGDPVVTLPDAPPSATGVAVQVGNRTSERVGRGGAGGGTGRGSGSGAGSAPTPVPMSVATIKTRALPRGDYGYFDAGKDYPAEARQLAIEGAIRVRLVVDPQGKVVSSVLLNKLGHGLDELALKRAAQIVFDPARDTDDHPVTSVVVWTFNMTLPK